MPEEHEGVRVTRCEDVPDTVSRVEVSTTVGPRRSVGVIGPTATEGRPVPVQVLKPEVTARERPVPPDETLDLKSSSYLKLHFTV